MPMTTKRTYGPPVIPATPSKTINSMLEQRCGKTHENILKAAISYYICGIFQAITTLYNIINPDKSKHSHTFWMVSCGIVGIILVLQAYLLYNIVMASAAVLRFVLFYAFILLGLAGGGMGISAMVFFDKDGAAPGSATKGMFVKPPTYTTSTPAYVHNATPSYVHDAEKFE